MTKSVTKFVFFHINELHEGPRSESAIGYGLLGLI